MPSHEYAARQAFSTKQRQVLQLAATGMTTGDLAAHLGVGRDDVGRSIASAIDALGASSKLEAVVIALRLGLIDLPAVDR